LLSTDKSHCRKGKGALIFCINLINATTKQSPKGLKLRSIVREEFKKNRHVTNPADIVALKSNAIRALSNYLILESGGKDARFRERLQKFNESERSIISSNNQGILNK
jgi:hypothetical protein